MSEIERELVGRAHGAPQSRSNIGVGSSPADRPRGAAAPAIAVPHRPIGKSADKGRKRIVHIRHGEEPLDNRTDTFFSTHGFDPVVRWPFAGDTLEMPDERLAGVVINGGSQALDDFEAHPWLEAEYRFIDECLKREIPMLGICMGAQQIALRLGGSVGPNKNNLRAFGYYEIMPTEDAGDFLTEPLKMPAWNWANFTIPSGATRLASNSISENAAFRYGDKVYGIQFHPDVTIEEWRRWQNASDWSGTPGTQTREEQDKLMYQADAPLAAWYYEFLERLFGSNGSTN